MGELPTFKNPKGITVRKLLDMDGLVLMNLLFKPGEMLEMHTTPQNVVFYVVNGEGTVMIGDEESRVKKDELVYSPKGIPHGLKAAEDQEFHVLVWKLPTA
ncbi:mannose-6-phosphate isomerase [Desulfoscipio gibsoniae DSM 7213]|uniref:Mannose-6-phosphate isomerase n=2 Tax=Desulfoscipio gibsoniae TaxID=102134 RepID=R4KIH6_9FIRM|nr:mannose-6-phosphate isomerase [Desulfoscipio gibsoniae DSM 7213]